MKDIVYIIQCLKCKSSRYAEFRNGLSQRVTCFHCGARIPLRGKTGIINDQAVLKFITKEEYHSLKMKGDTLSKVVSSSFYGRKKKLN